MPTAASKTFQLQGTRDLITWTTITTLTTDANGRASLFYTPVTNLYYRAVFAGTADLAAANSNQVRTVVRQLALLRPTNNGATKTINRNTSITFTHDRPAGATRAGSGDGELLLLPVQLGRLSARDARVTWSSTAPGWLGPRSSSRLSGHWYVRSQANPTAVQREQRHDAGEVPSPLIRRLVASSPRPPDGGSFVRASAARSGGRSARLPRAGRCSLGSCACSSSRSRGSAT